MLEKLIESRNEERTKLDALLGKVEEEDRTELSEDENAEFDTRSEKIKALDERIAELEEAIKSFDSYRKQTNQALLKLRESLEKSNSLPTPN